MASEQDDYERTLRQRIASLERAAAAWKDQGCDRSYVVSFFRDKQSYSCLMMRAEFNGSEPQPLATFFGRAVDVVGDAEGWLRGRTLERPGKEGEAP